MKRLLALSILAVSSAFAVDSGLLNLVTPDAVAVGGIYVDRTVASPLGQFILSKASSEDGFKRFIATTGFDPRRDLREIVFASPTIQGKQGLVAARGTFNAPQLFAAAKAEGATVTRYAGIDVLQLKAKGVLAVLDASILLVGDDALVKMAIDRRSGGKPLDTKLTSKIQDVGARYDAWIVSTAPLTPMKLPSQQTATLQGIEQTSAGVKFGATVQIDGEAVTRSDKDASALADVVRFLVGMVLMQKAPDAPPFATLLQSLEVKVDANTVRLSLAVPQSDIEKIFAAPVKRAAAVR